MGIEYFVYFADENLYIKLWHFCSPKILVYIPLWHILRFCVFYGENFRHIKMGKYTWWSIYIETNTIQQLKSWVTYQKKLFDHLCHLISTFLFYLCFDSFLRCFFFLPALRFYSYEWNRKTREKTFSLLFRKMQPVIHTPGFMVNFIQTNRLTEYCILYFTAAPLYLSI